MKKDGRQLLRENGSQACMAGERVGGERERQPGTHTVAMHSLVRSRACNEPNSQPLSIRSGRHRRREEPSASKYVPKESTSQSEHEQGRWMSGLDTNKKGEKGVPSLRHYDIHTVTTHNTRQTLTERSPTPMHITSTARKKPPLPCHELRLL
mmetsp:Transcript_6412/g.15498  ORF Transcript_6412/g.15498 Transcript_6412/m.15498 type:complete len:152 (-) Transcript_6412:1093-1548(-)